MSDQPEPRSRGQQMTDLLRSLTTRDTRGDMLAAAGFIGQILSPFFLQDPERGSAGSSFEALASLDAAAAGAEWPFVDDGVATACIASFERRDQTMTLVISRGAAGAAQVVATIE